MSFCQEPKIVVQKGGDQKNATSKLTEKRREKMALQPSSAIGGLVGGQVAVHSSDDVILAYWSFTFAIVGVCTSITE